MMLRNYSRTKCFNFYDLLRGLKYFLNNDDIMLSILYNDNSMSCLNKVNSQEIFENRKISKIIFGQVKGHKH